MTEVLFYHLDRQPLERVLPVLLEKSVERGWRVVVEAATAERVEALDNLLWTYADDSFLPHGTDREPDAERQPVLLTSGPARANGASVRFLVDGAGFPDDLASYQRIVVLFDGHDPDAVEGARAQWKAARAAGHACTYWQQGETGRWERKA